MKKIIINIISKYSPGKRFDNLWNLITILYTKYDINLVLQNYPSEILQNITSNFNKISIQIAKAINCAYARNIFLEKFYKSEYEYAILLDDDICLIKKPYTKEKNIIKYFIENISTMPKDAGILVCESNKFVYRYLKKPRIYKRIDMFGGCCLIKNFKKFYNKEIYFDDELKILDDLAFSAESYINGIYTIWHRGQCAFIEVGKSTYGNPKERHELFTIGRKDLVNKYPSIFKLTKNNKIKSILS